MSSILSTGLDSTQRVRPQYNAGREKTEGEEGREKAGGPPPPNTDTYSPSAAAVAMSILSEEAEEATATEAESTEVAAEETLFDYMDGTPVDEELEELDEFLASIDETVMDEVDGDDVEVDSDDVEVDGDDVEVDGDDVDVDTDDSSEVATDDVERVHGFARSITDADLAAMKYAMMTLQMSSYGYSSDSLFDYMDEDTANKISDWFSDSSSTTDEVDDLLSALESLFPSSTTETEDTDEDVEVDSDVIDPVEDSEEVDSDVIDSVEDSEIEED